MGRRQRVHYAGAVYHVFARGVDRRPIFIDDDDRRSFIQRMRRITSESGARIHAYCLMGNHFHMAIQVGVVPLSKIMLRILSGYCMEFNRRHGRTGHLFETRHHAFLCMDDNYLLGLINYIHMNPVRARLVLIPADWPWSSYAPGASADEGFENFDPWPEPPEIANMIRSREVERPSLDSIGEFVSVRTKIAMTVIRSPLRKPAVIAARREIVLEAVRNGHAIKSAADWLNISRRSASRYVEETYGQTAGLTPLDNTMGAAKE